MNLSFNKIGVSKSPNLAFKGLKGEMDVNNTERFQFTPPPHRHDEKVTVELVLLEKDNKTGLFVPSKDGKTFNIKLADDKPTGLPQENLGNNQAFAYRYRIEDNNGNTRYYNDESKTVNLDGIDGKMNIINQGSNFNYGVSPKGGTMYHAFVDSNAKTAKPGTRSHFNKLGGTLRDIIDLLKDGSFDPYTYLMLNPDIGADRISSHKYWPENQYQCNNMDDFKELNRELFKRGKSYVADGAFTSQGLNSPLVQHVFKWGEESPFYDMLKATAKDGAIRFGVLPDRNADDKVNVYENIGIRLVNSSESKDYDKSKPTYIQFFDKRLLSPEKQKDTKNLYFDYDNEPDDHYDTVKHQDSVLPLAFEVDTKKFADKIKAFKGQPFLMLNQIEDLDSFLTFDKVSISTKNNSAGVVNWDGNVDIIKMNTSNPDKGKEKGCEAARDYLHGVATFWTETVQRELLLSTALMDDKQKADVAKNNGIYKDQLERIKFAMQGGMFNSRILNQNYDAEHYVKEFPLQSLETAPELGAVFSEPQFNGEFLAADADGKTVQEALTNIVETTINNAIPDKYKNNKEYKAYVTKMFAPEILRSVIAGAMDPNTVNDKNGKIDLDKLKNVNIRTFIKNPENPKEERKEVIKGVAKGISADSAKGIEKQIASQLKKISLEDFKLSESIVLQGKGGLNWRFDAAKDIGDLDAIRNKNIDFKEVWEGEYGVVPFWRDFIHNIREHNPSSYIINEITDLGNPAFYKWKDEESMRKYGGDAAVEQWNRLNDGEKEYYKYHIAYQTEKEYLAETNSTTTSMFDEGFNKFSAFTGVDPETGSCNNSGSIKELMHQMKELQKFSQPNNTLYAHFFTQNHDKPTLLHALPLDMGLFYRGTIQETNNEIYKQMAKNVTGGRTDYDHISSKAVAVGYMLKQGIKENVDPRYHDKLFASLENLVNGKRKKEDKNDFNRAEAFATLPYELSLKDIIDDAGLTGKIDPLELQFNILEDAREQQMAMTRTSNAIPGVYTLFNGAEFGQTGFETPNKNVHVDNRNRILRELANNPLFSSYYKETQANLGLYKELGMSALSGGFTRSLNIQKVNIDNSDDFETQPANKANFEKFKESISKYLNSKKDWPKGGECLIHPDVMFETIKTADDMDLTKILKDMNIPIDEMKDFKAEIPALEEYFTKADSFTLEMAPVFAYDEKGSKTLVISTNNGLPALKDVGNGARVQVKTEKQQYDFPALSIVDKETGTAPLEDGTILKRKVYDAAKGKYVDEPAEYIINNGQLMKKSAVGKQQLGDDDYLSIDDTTAIFYVPRDGQMYEYLAAKYNGTNK